MHRVEIDNSSTKPYRSSNLNAMKEMNKTNNNNMHHIHMDSSIDHVIDIESEDLMLRAKDKELCIKERGLISKEEELTIRESKLILLEEHRIDNEHEEESNDASKTISRSEIGSSLFSNAELIKREQRIEIKEDELLWKIQDVERREDELNDREIEIRKIEDDLHAKEDELMNMQNDVDDKENELDARQIELDHQQEKLIKRKNELNNHNQFTNKVYDDDDDAATMDDQNRTLLSNNDYYSHYNNNNSAIQGAKDETMKRRKSLHLKLQELNNSNGLKEMEIDVKNHEIEQTIKNKEIELCNKEQKLNDIQERINNNLVIIHTMLSSENDNDDCDYQQIDDDVILSNDKFMEIVEKIQTCMQSKNNIIQNQQQDLFEINTIVQNKESFIIQLNSDAIETKQKNCKLMSMLHKQIEVNDDMSKELQNIQDKISRQDKTINDSIAMINNDDKLLIKEQESKIIKLQNDIKFKDMSISNFTHDKTKNYEKYEKLLDMLDNQILNNNNLVQKLNTKDDDMQVDMNDISENLSIMEHEIKIKNDTILDLKIRIKELTLENESLRNNTCQNNEKESNIDNKILNAIKIHGKVVDSKYDNIISRQDEEILKLKNELEIKDKSLSSCKPNSTPSLPSSSTNATSDERINEKLYGQIIDNYSIAITKKDKEISKLKEQLASKNNSNNHSMNDQELLLNDEQMLKINKKNTTPAITTINNDENKRKDMIITKLQNKINDKNENMQSILFDLEHLEKENETLIQKLKELQHKQRKNNNDDDSFMLMKSNNNKTKLYNDDDDDSDAVLSILNYDNTLEVFQKENIYVGQNIKDSAMEISIVGLEEASNDHLDEIIDDCASSHNLSSIEPYVDQITEIISVLQSPSGGWSSSYKPRTYNHTFNKNVREAVHPLNA